LLQKSNPAELQLGMDLENLIGLSATLFIVHNETDERTYANIESVLAYKSPNGTPDPYGIEPSGHYTRVIHREGYKEPLEYAASVNGQHA